SALLSSASYYAGEASFRVGRHEKAITHFTRVVKDFASDPIAEPATLRLGECQAVLQRWALSERVFKDYLDRFGDRDQWFAAQFGVGWACENQKRYDDAIEAYRRVVERHQGPTAARAQFQIGQCLFAQKKFDSAVRELLKVDILYAYPEWSAAALYEAGRCFTQLGDPAEARKQFTEVAEKYKDTKWAEPASRQLLELSAAAALPGR
ncbi:MAG: tetratricopeptide repeat protein, partial [Phycisphaerales bacterium]|nr:tetratricopeptide repeat protein [Phycisphaerales bacterium]